MIKVFLLCSFFAKPLPNCELMPTIRERFHNITNETELKNFISFAENCACEAKEPYLASAIMQKAQYVYFPNQKWAAFSEGKKRLENHLTKYPNDIEGRYVRALVQHEIPAFLGYSGQLSSDVAFVKQNIQKQTLSADYKAVILKNIAKIK